ncbi:hypothetical protein FQN52_005334 [Onygenales sp. PD_12]|nr:hypothetical protein FQN52_005334 [Onygenales sp. PD_12]
MAARRSSSHPITETIQNTRGKVPIGSAEEAGRLLRRENILSLPRTIRMAAFKLGIAAESARACVAKLKMPKAGAEVRAVCWSNFNGYSVSALPQPRQDGAETTMTTDAEVAVRNHKLPVLWHRLLPIFAQRYLNGITEDQQEVVT